MRAASIIICDIIAQKNMFNDEPDKPGSILVFLPGMAEIMEFINYMKEFYDKEFFYRKLEMIPLHSSLNEEE